MSTLSQMNEALAKPLDSSSKAALVGGTPLATITVWYLEEVYCKPRGITMSTPVAVAFGVIGATFFGELWSFFTLLAQKLLERLK